MTPSDKNQLPTIAAILTVAAYALEPARKLKGMEEHDYMGKLIQDYKNLLQRLQNLG
jgi:hypothetical protein